MKNEKNAELEREERRILIGDDQYGAQTSEGERMRRSFELDYRDQLKSARLEYVADSNLFIEMARTGVYNILMIDLNWEPDDAIRDFKTGYRILEAVRDFAPKRILWTSESMEDREKGYLYGATHCVRKGLHPTDFENLMNDDNQLTERREK